MRALSQGKLVQLYTARAIKTCQGKLLEKNLFSVHTSKESYQGTCKGKLDFLCGLKRSNTTIEHLTARNQSSSTLGQKSDLVELAITSGFLREKVSFSLILRNYTGFLLNLIFGILK